MKIVVDHRENPHGGWDPIIEEIPDDHPYAKAIEAYNRALLEAEVRRTDVTRERREFLRRRGPA